MTAAIVVGLLTTGGVYLVLQRGIVRMALGFVLLGHAATTLLVASGGVGRRGVPFIGASGVAADPLPQAFRRDAPGGARGEAHHRRGQTGGEDGLVDHGLDLQGGIIEARPTDVSSKPTRRAVQRNGFRGGRISSGNSCR